MIVIVNIFIFGVGVEWGIIFVIFVIFVIFIIFLKKFVWGLLKEVMDKCECDINKDIDDVE